ncbi:MAG: hypothetical protein FD153_30 [Rhodospirillaceae bacterium]|nr:MAG: hypothetical protein FD153_30 [Rhodospirillaceae bacterium]
MIDSIGTGYWIPPIPTAEQRKSAEKVLETLDRSLRPAKKEWLATRISILLDHYGQGGQRRPSLEREMIVTDWLQALSDLPEHAVAQACQDALVTCQYRPTPCDIHTRAMEAVGDATQTRDRLKAVLAVPPAENVVVEALWPLVRRREIRRSDVDILIRPLAVTMQTEHVTGRMRGGHPGLHNPGERGKTESLLRRAADQLKREHCYLIGPSDLEPIPPTPEERERQKQVIQELLSRFWCSRQGRNEHAF